MIAPASWEALQDPGAYAKAQAALSTFYAREWRRNAAIFCQAVLREERTGDPIKLAPFHHAWHRLIDQHKRLVLLSHIESGKTNMITVGRSLYELARDPDIRIAIVSNTQSQAVKFLSSIKDYIEKSTALHELCSLERGPIWQKNQITVKRSHISKDPSIQAVGIHGALLGSRIDFIIVDDILDYENTRTEAQREEVIRWFNATVMGRLTENARIVVVNTAFHKKDLLHTLCSNPTFAGYKFPVVRQDGRSNWPERWPPSRIEEWYRGDPAGVEFLRQLMCDPVEPGEQRFQREWINHALRLGVGKSLIPSVRGEPYRLPIGWRVYTGVDMGTRRKASADLSALATIAVGPSRRRELIGLDSGRWSGPELLARILEAQQRFGSTLIVENNAAQQFIIDFAKDARTGKPRIPIRPFTTGANKLHPEYGVESLAAEMAVGLWVIPSKSGLQGEADPEVEALVEEFLSYRPGSHTGDRQMALWFAREGARLDEEPKPRAETGRNPTR